MGLDKNMLGTGSVFRNFTDYPKCKIFNCIRSRGVKSMCCAYCDKKAICRDPCMNDPTKCGQCVFTKKESAEEVGYISGSLDYLPDAPDIARAERTGCRPFERTEDDEPEPVCPICGKECESLYFDCDNDLFGCDLCVKKISAWEYKHRGMER